MSDAATLGRQIRHYRNRAGFTLDELGARVGIAGSQLSIIENGKREIKLGMLTAIAEALVTGGDWPQGMTELGVTPDAVTPERLWG